MLALDPECSHSIFARFRPSSEFFVSLSGKELQQIVFRLASSAFLGFDTLLATLLATLICNPNAYRYCFPSSAFSTAFSRALLVVVAPETASTALTPSQEAHSSRLSLSAFSLASTRDGRRGVVGGFKRRYPARLRIPLPALLDLVLPEVFSSRQSRFGTQPSEHHSLSATPHFVTRLFEHPNLSKPPYS